MIETRSALTPCSVLYSLFSILCSLLIGIADIAGICLPPLAWDTAAPVLRITSVISKPGVRI
ncbi:MAG: hypothetical protein FWG89_06140 [Treponema sp.]|nr:hypothetical protein [Treponema sp.]